MWCKKETIIYIIYFEIKGKQLRRPMGLKQQKELK